MNEKDLEKVLLTRILLFVAFKVGIQVGVYFLTKKLKEGV